MINQHSLGIGTLYHERKQPKSHEFSTKTYMLLVNLSECHSQKNLKLGWLSHFSPKDYWDKQQNTISNLKHAVITAWKNKGLTIDHVLLLSNPRAINTKMNPLSVFYCYYQNKLVGIIAEVTNTPWGERHHYFLCVKPCQSIEADAFSQNSHQQKMHFKFNKSMHVSPFNPCNLCYEMLFTQNGDNLAINMTLYNHKNEAFFNAYLTLTLTKLSKKNWFIAFIKKPWITLQIKLRIYLEALKLAGKGMPFYKHPKHAKNHE